MTIEELKAQTSAPPPDIDFVNAGHWALMDLAPEILALVEAASEMRLLDCRCIGPCDCFTPGMKRRIDQNKAAVHAFNAALAAL